MWVWVWLWLPECEMMELWDARWLPMKEERRDKSTLSHVNGTFTNPGRFQYVRDQRPTPWRKSARFSPTGPTPGGSRTSPLCPSAPLPSLSRCISLSGHLF